jgi:hypothetical protein
MHAKPNWSAAALPPRVLREAQYRIQPESASFRAGNLIGR